MFMLGQMRHFPLVVADGFYEDPMKIRDFALQQEYKRSENGEFPGKRTLPLSLINEKLNMYCCSKFMNLFLELHLTKETSWDIVTQFQIIESYDNESSLLNDGWIHVDNDVAAAAVVYLTPDANPNCGTTLYVPNPSLSNEQLGELDLMTDKRKHFNLTGEVEPDYIETMQKYNSNFQETAIVKNVFNRAIAYDSNMYHKASSHYNALDEFRLTQVFFLRGLRTDGKAPLDRIKS